MLTAPRPDYLATADERIVGGAHRPDRRPLQAAGDAAAAVLPRVPRLEVD